jgi:hypothetical protein
LDHPRRADPLLSPRAADANANANANAIHNESEFPMNQHLYDFRPVRSAANPTQDTIRINNRDALQKVWERFLLDVSNQITKRVFASFSRWCHQRGLSPDDINAERLADYCDWVSRRTVDPNPRATTIRMRKAWNDLQSRWPPEDFPADPAV